MQTEEQGNKYTKRLHFLNPSLLNMQRPKTNSKERWNKSSLFLSSSSYPSWVHSIRLQGVWAQLHKVEYEASWSILSREMRWRWTDKGFFFFFLQIFWILLRLLWYEQTLDSYAALFKGNCKGLCPSIITDFYNCMEYCPNKTTIG